MKKQLLMTSEVAFSLKHDFLIKNSLLRAGNLAPSYHCSTNPNQTLEVVVTIPNGSQMKLYVT
jgi:hypothetical protein